MKEPRDERSIVASPKGPREIAGICIESEGADIIWKAGLPSSSAAPLVAGESLTGGAECNGFGENWNADDAGGFNRHDLKSINI